MIFTKRKKVLTVNFKGMVKDTPVRKSVAQTFTLEFIKATPGLLIC